MSTRSGPDTDHLTLTAWRDTLEAARPLRRNAADFSLSQVCRTIGTSVGPYRRTPRIGGFTMNDQHVYPTRTWLGDDGKPMSPAAQSEAELEHIYAWCYEYQHPHGKQWEDLTGIQRAAYRSTWNEAELWHRWTTDRPALYAEMLHRAA